MVWDTDKPEELVVAPTSEHSHSEPITKVCCIQSTFLPFEKKYRVLQNCSVSSFHQNSSASGLVA